MSTLYNAKMALQRAFYLPTPLLSCDVALENVEYTPQADTKYAKLTFSPEATEPLTMGIDGDDLVKGYFYIELFYPKNTGDAQACTDFEIIRARYRSGVSFTYNGTVATIIACSRTQGSIVDETYYRIRVNIFFHTRTSRQ
jgi:hypothetical protein